MLRQVIADRDDFVTDVLDHLRGEGARDPDNDAAGTQSNAVWLERQHPLAQAMQRRFRSAER